MICSQSQPPSREQSPPPALYNQKYPDKYSYMDRTLNDFMGSSAMPYNKMDTDKYRSYADLRKPSYHGMRRPSISDYFQTVIYEKYFFFVEHVCP
jgi:hypothetical protein